MMSFSIVQDVIDSPLELSSAEFGVLVVLARYADEEGKCFPSVETISERSRLCVKSVKKAIKSLQEFGVISTEQAPGKKRFYKLSLEVVRGGANITRVKNDPGKKLPGSNVTPVKNAPGCKSAPGGDANFPQEGGQICTGRGVKNDPRIYQLRSNKEDINEDISTVHDSCTVPRNKNKKENTLLNSNSTANTQTVRRSTSSILRGTFDAPLFAPFKSEVPDYIDPNSLERPERAKKNEWTDAPERATNTLAKLQAEEQASAVSFSFLFSSSLFCPDEYHSYAVAICRANGVDPTDALIDRIWDAFKESITNKDEKRSLKAWRSGWASLVNKVCQTTSKGAQA